MGAYHNIYCSMTGDNSPERPSKVISWRTKKWNEYIEATFDKAHVTPRTRFYPGHPLEAAFRSWLVTKAAFAGIGNMA